MKKYIVLSEKSWHRKTFENLKNRFPEDDWILMTDREQFNEARLEEVKPDRIFIPHWSYIIPKEIYKQYQCIVFHMTDLPYGRGGSPLQNLITRGISNTKISAIRVEEGIDSGPVYLKKDLLLSGTAREIFLRASIVIEEMIGDILKKDPVPQSQHGEVITFKRRKPEDGDIARLDSIASVYDYIRMLDCEGYPKAYIENENFRFEFSRAALESEKEIFADVRIIKK